METAKGRAMADSSRTAYTTKQLADLAQVSSRTLRYYDQRGLLVPRRNASGYRIYGPSEVKRLQHILLLRSCGMALSAIERVLDGESCDLAVILSNHLDMLRRQSSQLEKSIAIVQNAIAGLEEFEAMNDTQKFEQLKQRSIERFEEEFGAEARERYGEEAIDGANDRFLNMSQEEWNEKEALEQRIKDTLSQAMAAGDPASETAHTLAAMHARWIQMHWGEGAYTPEAHRALARGYLADPRFIAYYDGAAGEGATAFLVAVIEECIE